VFDSVKTILGMLEVSVEFALKMTFNWERIQKALPSLLVILMQPH